MGETEDQLYNDDEATTLNGQGGGGKKKLIFIVLFLLILGGGGAGAYFSGMLDAFKEETAKTDEPPPPPPTKSVYVDLPDMLVNLNSDAAKPHFLKFQASLELSSDVDVTSLLPFKPRIIDKFQVYVRELRLEDLRADGGLKMLREELLAQINEVIKPVRAKNVLFRNLLVQ